MKHLRALLLTMLLAMSLISTSHAAEVPDNLVVENLNGRQQIVKTYTLSPEVDPETLKGVPFDYEGYHYTWAYTTKEETPREDTRVASETVTVEMSSKDMNKILAAFAPTMDYDDGQYTGTLALDHTTISTKAAGYTTKYGTVTDTKVIENLDRNDMSYVPNTTVKDGSTLTLVNVEWQVTGTDLVGDTLMPCTYQAVATYSASYSYQVATGYVSTAEYRGTVTASGVDSITYTVVYTGTEIVPEIPSTDEPADAPALPVATIDAIKGSLLLILLLAALAGTGAFLILRRKNVYLYVPGNQPRDYKLAAKFRVEPRRPEIDITDVDPYPDCTVAVEIRRSLAKKLRGQTFTVHYRGGDYTYTVTQDSPGDWHEFDASEEKEELI